MKIEGARHPVISVCPFKGVLRDFGYKLNSKQKPWFDQLDLKMFSQRLLTTVLMTQITLNAEWYILNAFDAYIEVEYKHHLYFISSRERPWHYWARPRIHVARRILHVSILVFLFECVRKHTSCACDDKRLPPEYALTSRSFSRWDTVYMDSHI